MTQNLTTTDDYRALIADLKTRIRSAQIKAAITVNRELIALYWDIGQLIAEKQRASGWGDAVIEAVAKDLSREFQTMKGFSRRNLYYMKRFYSFHAGRDEFVQQLVAQIPWGHNILILENIKEQEKALWYVQKTLENGWSRNALGLQIDNRLYERQATLPKIDNFAERLPAPQSDLARQTLKDPYLFDFLDVGEETHERELETALVDRITRFLLELGKGFAFVGRQYHLEVGGDDFYIDLLFYHVRLHCYVALELKTGPFKPEIHRQAQLLPHRPRRAGEDAGRPAVHRPHPLQEPQQPRGRVRPAGSRETDRHRALRFGRHPARGTQGESPHRGGSRSRVG